MMFTEDDINHDIEWKHVSASQLSTARLCLTKAYLSRRTPRSSSPATELGTNVHSANESYLLRGEESSGDDKVDLIAKSMRPRLPAPGHPSAFVESEIHWQPDNWPVPIVGYVDVVEPEGTCLSDGEILESPRITDEKTTSNWSYMRTPEELADDTQGIFYGAWSLLAPDGPFVGEDSIEFRHVTAVTKGKTIGTSREVSYTFAKTELEEKLKGLLPEVLTLKELHSLNWPEDLDKIPYDNSSCWKYGRCEFWDICSKYGRTPVSKKTKTEQAANELLELIGETK